MGTDRYDGSEQDHCQTYHRRIGKRRDLWLAIVLAVVSVGIQIMSHVAYGVDQLAPNDYFTDCETDS